VDKSGLLIAEDLVRNDLFLRNRPKVLDLGHLNETDIADLCARYSIAVFDRAQGLALGILANNMYQPNDAMRTAMARLSCGSQVSIGGADAARPASVPAR
jgi:hypothetical protein